jgi:hypothetical protein
MALSTLEHHELQQAITTHLCEIIRLFKPGAKITVVVTNDAYGDAGVVIGDDSLVRAAVEIERRVPGTLSAAMSLPASEVC